MNGFMNNNKQIEMTLPAPAEKNNSRLPAKRERRQKAQWWFNQMRMVVDAAFDWKSAPPAHPEQTSLALNGRN
jgi:hypothetical protein